MRARRGDHVAALPADIKMCAQPADADLKTALDEAGVSPQTADAIVEENATARLDALRLSLSALALIALVALFVSRRIPTKQPASASAT